MAEMNPSLFASLVYSLNMTAMQQMGKILNPMTGKLEKDMEQARVSIDMLLMLAEKTRNNLTLDEDQFMKQVLSQLEQAYAQLSAQ